MKQTSKGSVAVYSLLMVSVVLLAGGGAISYSYTSMARSKSDSKNSASNEAAQAALEYGLTKAFKDVQVTKGTFIARNDNFSSDLSDMSPKLTSVGCVVAPTNDPAFAWVTASATVDGRTNSVRVYVKAKDVGIWNNAIFAGAGASGQAINGNVDIRGSVHILGDGEPFIDVNGNKTWDKAETYTDSNNNGSHDPGEPFVDADNNGVWTPAEPYNDVNSNNAFDPPIAETSLNSAFSGNSGVYNHYEGLDAGLKATVPPPPNVGGVETLGAEVRVKNGLIGISGSASIGNSGTVNGGSMKSKIDGSFVSAGYTGNQGANSVYSDNGTGNDYDLGQLGIAYPLISGIGAQKYQDADGVVWNTQEEFLNARSLTVPVALVKSTTAAFSYGPDVYGNKFKFTPATNNAPCKLEVHGVIKVPSGFQLGVKDKIYYDGSGTLYSPGDLKIDGDLLPIAGKLFPTTARIGLIAKKDLLLACGNGSAQLKLSGAFYAQGKVKSAKQNQVMGTFVGSYYDLGTNVPSIFQVPTLSKNLPPAMPGDKPYIMLDIKSWRARKATDAQ